MPAVRLVPMSPERYPDWARASISGFAEQQVASGTLPEREAREYAEREFDSLLPEGLLTPGQHVWSAYDGPDEVGSLWLGLRTGSEGPEGYVYDVAVAPGLRGRGLGRALMLAGEAQAHSLGARTMRLTVFGHNEPARGLYGGLGYETAATQMTRRLDRPRTSSSPGAPVVRLEPAGRAQYERYRATAERRYAEAIAESGMAAAQEARAKSAADYARLLPDGLDTPGHFFWTAYDGEAEVGLAWIHETARSDGPHAYGYDLLVAEPLRRHGYGRAIMLAVEDVCRARGVVSVALTVFGHNPGARALYEQMGFAASATLLRKPLGQSSAAGAAAAPRG
ncbi:MAG TPA: GNAT family N-acetyltransferase [Nocardioidaceae bacterium]|nr:GNAT family N-acetyltransferase [Nocardioidaceae bacterium]